MATTTVTVIVNGDSIDVAQGASIQELYVQLDLDAKWVVAEHNGMPVPRHEVAAILLHDGDQVELVKAVAGG